MAVERSSVRSFDLMALVIYDDACFEPRYLGFIAARGLSHVFTPGAFIITVLRRLVRLPDTAADTLVVVKELLAD
jgi:hypothetical protein